MMDEVFHRGERALQAQAGMRARLHAIGPQIIRDAMPEQHRAFFAELPMIFLSTLDAEGMPWASVVAGAPGFAHATGGLGLHIEGALHAQDPLRARLLPGAPVGVLGLQLQTRRRNRANGVVLARRDDEQPPRVELEIMQSFGNCPKHIHPRQLTLLDAGPVRWSNVEHEGRHLSAEALALIARADTYFIASSSSRAPVAGREGEGLDVSHRGGPAGFVTSRSSVEPPAGQTVLSAPDYAGNFFFNTLGNLSLYPHAGLLFLDFEAGALLALSTDVTIEDAPGTLRHHPAAERLLHFSVREGFRVTDALPFRAV